MNWWKYLSPNFNFFKDAYMQASHNLITFRHWILQRIKMCVFYTVALYFRSFMFHSFNEQ